MSSYESNQAAPFGAITIFRVLSRLDDVFDAVRTWRRARATEAALAALTDKQLADIGLHRGAIADVAATLAEGR